MGLEDVSDGLPRDGRRLQTPPEVLGVNPLDATGQGSGDGGDMEGGVLREGGNQRGNVARQCSGESGYTTRPKI